MLLKRLVLLAFTMTIGHSHAQTCAENWLKYCKNDVSIKCFQQFKVHFDKDCQHRIYLMDNLKGDKNSCRSQLKKHCKVSIGDPLFEKCLRQQRALFSPECHEALISTHKKITQFGTKCKKIVSQKCGKYAGQQQELLASCMHDVQAELPKKCAKLLK